MNRATRPVAVSQRTKRIPLRLPCKSNVSVIFVHHAETRSRDILAICYVMLPTSRGVGRQFC